MHVTVPVRFGRGRLDSLVPKGLAAYLIAADVNLPAQVDRTDVSYLYLQCWPQPDAEHVVAGRAGAQASSSQRNQYAWFCLYHFRISR
jgi:hypothetical protein